MLDPASWLPEAQSLRVGGRARVSHDCGTDASMLVSHKADGYHAWCFRCGEGGFKRKEPTLQDMVDMQRRAGEDRALRRSVSLPVPMDTSVREWPREARLWLYKAGLHDGLIQSLGIYFHRPTQRVVLPVVEDGQVTYWQARAVMKGQEPKYLNPQVDRDTVLPRFGSGPRIVLTEDFLSAARVGQVTEAWSLLGTNLKDPVLSRLVRDGRPVDVWLDPDKAGRKAAASITKALRTLGIEARNIISRRDPKLLSTEELKECLRFS